MRLERRREPFGRGAIESVAVFLDRHLCHDRQITNAPDGRDCRSNLVEIAECLEHEEINAAGQQGFGLLATKGFRFVSSGLAPRLDSDPQRANRARDIRAPARHFPGKASAFDVDVAQPIGQAEPSQLDPVGSESVRLDEICASAYVFLMYFHDAGRLGEVQCVEAPIDEDTFGVQHRAHRAVADEHTFVDRVEKWLHTETKPRRHEG